MRFLRLVIAACATASITFTAPHIAAAHAAPSEAQSAALVAPSPAQEEAGVIRVDFRTATLTYVVRGEVQLKARVVLPRPRAQYPLPVTGKVTRVWIGAPWYPTENIRRSYKRRTGKELPRVIPGGDPRNAMGAGKVMMRFDQRTISPSVRIHGNAREEDLGRRLSAGCLRLTDEAFLALAALVGERAPAILFFRSEEENVAGTAQQ